MINFELNRDIRCKRIDDELSKPLSWLSNTDLDDTKLFHCNNNHDL